MKALDFSDFPPTTEADWREKIAADVAGRDESLTLFWEAEPGLVLDAVATRASLERARKQWPMDSGTSSGDSWTSVQYVPLQADGRDETRLLSALARADRVLIDYHPTAISTVLQTLGDDLPRHRLVIDGKTVDDWPALSETIATIDVLPPDMVMRRWFHQEDVERAPRVGDARQDNTTIDTRGVRTAVDSVVIESALIASALAYHTTRTPKTTINIVTPLGPRIFLEMSKLIVLRELLHRHEILHGSRIWAVVGDNLDSDDRREHQIRLTYAAVAAVLGGAHCVVTIPHSADADCVSLAANVPLIFRHESDLQQAVHTLQGSYYVGTVASQIGRQASSLKDGLLSAGGLDSAAGRSLLADAIASYKSTVAS